MMKALDATHHLYTPVQAEALAAQMQASEDDGWVYTAVHDPKGTGYSFIKAYDENGKFVSKM